MASKHTTKKRTLRGRVHTRTRDVARRLKYDVPDLDIPTLERELCTQRFDGFAPITPQQRRIFGGAL